MEKEKILVRWWRRIDPWTIAREITDQCRLWSHIITSDGRRGINPDIWRKVCPYADWHQDAGDKRVRGYPTGAGPESGKLPIIIITGTVLSMSPSRALKLVAQGFLLKPFTAGELRSCWWAETLEKTRIATIITHCVHSWPVFWGEKE